MKPPQNPLPDLEDTEDEIFQFFANNYDEYINDQSNTHDYAREEPDQTKRQTTKVR